MFAVDLDRKALEETLRPIEGEGGEVTAHTCDVTDSCQVRTMVSSSVAST